MVCRKCNKNIEKNINFCPYCGKKINNIIMTILRIFVFILVLFIILYSVFIFPFSYYFYSNTDLTSDKVIDYIKSKNCDITREKIDSNNKSIYIYKTDVNSCDFDIKYAFTTNEDYKRKQFNQLSPEVFSCDFFTSGNYHFICENDYYTIIIRTVNDIIYFKTDIKNKDLAQKMLVDLGYGKFVNYKSFPDGILIGMLFILFIISWWNINKKINRKEWICLIPIYNLMCLIKDIYGSKKYYYIIGFNLLSIICFFPNLIINFPFLLQFIIVISFILTIYFSILSIYKLGKAFQKSNWFIFLMIILPYIFIPILALDDSKYIGPIKK